MMPDSDFNVRVHGKVTRDQVLWGRPIVKFARDVSACPAGYQCDEE